MIATLRHSGPSLRRHAAKLLLAAALLAFLGFSVGRGIAAEPPAIPREFRAMWVASVGNIDWPSRPGLPIAQQQQELRALLDGARGLKLNAVILQVRTACDALYASALEPWSEYLTGRMGQAPGGGWDPLKFACAEAHARGLELHAWVNPFRARYHQAISPISADHISARHPDWVISYVRHLWLDPGNPAVRDWSLQVITDIVRRYDVDGLHMDDYFYPYPEKVGGANAPFPDDASYQRYRRGGGTLERDDWRRDCISQFVQRVNASIHATKPWVKFGISPFGIWRPGFPAGIKGFDSFALLHADARLWLQNGWCDYCAPQLYWGLDRKEQAFQPLLKWWIEQNPAGRWIVPGLSSASIGKDRRSDDIANQVRLTRQEPGAAGVVFWNASSLRDNLGGLAGTLNHDVFARPALVPAAPWLGKRAPGRPVIEARFGNWSRTLRLAWKPGAGEPVSVLVMQSRTGNQWSTELLAGTPGGRELGRKGGTPFPDEVRVSAVSRTGIQGESAVFLRPPNVR